MKKQMAIDDDGIGYSRRLANRTAGGVPLIEYEQIERRV